MTDMSNKSHATTDAWYRAALYTAIIAGVFSLVVSALLIANGLRFRATIPLTYLELAALRRQVTAHPKDQDITQPIAMTARELSLLKMQLSRHPKDQALKNVIRKLDKQLRTEYFRRKAFAQQGIYLLLGCIALLLLAGKLARDLHRKLPNPKDSAEDADLRRHAMQARRAVTTAGLVLGGALFTFALLPRDDLSARFAQAVIQFAPKATIAAEPKNSGTAEPTGSEETATPDDTSANENASATVIDAASDGPSTAESDDATSQGNGPTETVAMSADYPTPEEWAKNWPVFRGPTGSGIVASGAYPTAWDGAKGKGILWKTKVPLPDHSSPVIWGDSIFLSGGNQSRCEVYCYNAATGELRWQKAVTRPADAPPVDVFADTGYAAPTMATDGRRAYAIFATGDVVAFDFQGKQAWVRSLGTPDNMYGHAASLAMYRSLLIVQFDQGSGDGGSALLALDGATGKTVWRAEREVPNSWTTPIVINTGKREEIITSADPWVIAYDPATGKEFWRADCMTGDVAPSPIFAGGLVFAVNTGAELAAITPGGSGNVTKSNKKWSAVDGLPDTVSPASDGKFVYLVTSDGTVTCYNAGDGADLWEQSMDASVYSSPTVVGDNVYLADENGIMHIFASADAFEEVATCPLGERVTATPAFMNGRIFIRGAKNLYCIGTK